VTASSVQISDHALVRWMQRTGMIDLEPLRAMLAASIEKAAAAGELLGVAEYLILADGLVYVVRSGVVVTVVNEDGRHSRVRALSGQPRERG